MTIVSRFESREALASMIEGEGGVLEVVDYGIKADDMPEGDTELIELWAEMRVAYKRADNLATKVHEILEPYGLA
jgi:hypothetical protein